MINEIDVFVSAHPWVFSLASLVVGLAAGSRLNYWNALTIARRKEFIDVADRIVPLLESDLAEPRPFSSKPTQADFNMIRRKLHRWRRPGFSAAVEAYKEAHGKDTELWEDTAVFIYKDDSRIKESIKKLLPYFDYR